MGAQQPRDGQVAVGGIQWLGRMIDKARLEANGEIEQFDLDYPCPMDQGLLSRLGVDSKTFQNIVVNANNDEEILSALKKEGAAV